MGGTGVTVGKLGTKKKSLEMFEGDTVGAVLKRAEVSSSGYEVRIRGNKVGQEYKIQPGDELILVPNIEAQRS